MARPQAREDRLQAGVLGGEADVAGEGEARPAPTAAPCTQAIAGTSSERIESKGS